MKIFRFFVLISMAFFAMSCSSMIEDLKGQHQINNQIFLEKIESDDFELGTSLPEGFVFDHQDEINNEDGSTTRKLYYKRVRATLTFDSNGGKFTDLNGNYTITGKYGATVNYQIPELKRDGFELSEPKWDNVLPETFPLQNMTFKARWKKLPVSIEPVISGSDSNDISITYDTASAILTAKIPFGSPDEWTFNWYDNMKSTPVSTEQTLSLSGFSSGSSHKIVLVALYNGSTFTKTLEITI